MLEVQLATIPVELLLHLEMVADFLYCRFWGSLIYFYSDLGKKDEPVSSVVACPSSADTVLTCTSVGRVFRVDTRSPAADSILSIDTAINSSTVCTTHSFIHTSTHPVAHPC